MNVNASTVFLFEVAASLAISTLILLRLRHMLRNVGNEVCEQGGRATDFWVAYTELMMLVAPLALIAWFSKAGQYYGVAQLQHSFGVVLTGQFIGLALVGRAVWKSIVRPTPPAPAAPREPRPILANGSPA